MKPKSEVFASNHFTIEQLDEGIFAVIQREGGWAIANSGIIDLGEISLVYDTFLTVQAATDLKKAAEHLTGKPVGFVINSHYHNDHIWGNQVFDSQTHIISSDDTLELIKTEGKEEYDLYKQISAARLEELKAEFDQAKDDEQRGNLSTWISYFQGLVETFPILSIRLPNLTFHNRLNIFGTDMDIELIAYKGGHTGCDTVLHIPSKNILFMSDLLFVGCHPFLADGDPNNLLSILDEIDQLEPRTLVPGHGPVGKHKDLNLMKEYILHCDRTGRLLAETDKQESDILEYPIPEQFTTWILPNFYTTNLRFFYDRYRGKIIDDQG